MAFFTDYDGMTKYNTAKRADFAIYEKLKNKAEDDFEKILTDMLKVMNAKNIYNSDIDAFCYNREEKLLLNAKEYCTEIFTELLTEMEKIDGIYYILGKTTAQNENLKRSKAYIIVEHFVFDLINISCEKFDEMLANYKDEK